MFLLGNLFVRFLNNSIQFKKIIVHSYVRSVLDLINSLEHIHTDLAGSSVLLIIYFAFLNGKILHVE